MTLILNTVTDPWKSVVFDHLSKFIHYIYPVSLKHGQKITYTCFLLELQNLKGCSAAKFTPYKSSARVKKRGGTSKNQSRYETNNAPPNKTSAGTVFCTGIIICK